MSDIEQYLYDNRPDMPADGSFLVEVNARLDAVEDVKQIMEREKRHGSTMLVVALLSGLLIGGALTAFVMLNPTPPAQMSHVVLARTIAFLARWKAFLPFPVAGCAIALGLLFSSRRKATF